MPRSPSPSHSSHSSKRRRYDDDNEERHRHSHSSRSNHRDDNYDHDRSHRSDRRRDRDYERDREYDRDYDRRDRDRDYRDSDRRRIRDRDRDYDRDYERSSRHHHDDRSSPRRRDDDHYSSRSHRSSRDDKRSSRYEASPGAGSRNGASRSPERPVERDTRPRSPVVPDTSSLPSKPSTATVAASSPAPSTAPATNGSDTPRGLNGSASPAPAGANGAASVAEEEKQRLKREKLAAWKKKREAAEASSAASASPSPAPASPAPSAAKVASPAPSSLPAKPSGLGLPAKPVAAINALPAKPTTAATPSSISSTTKTTVKSFTPAASPADAAASAAAAAAAISSRLSSLGAARSNPLSASLPAKPSFSFSSAAPGATGGSKLKNSLTMGEDDGAETKKPGMIKFDAEEVSMDVAGEDEDEDDDLEGDTKFSGTYAAARAKARMAALEAGSEEGQKDEDGDTEMKEEGDGAGAGAKEEEEEEEDELDAFMNGVNAQVKKVDSADKEKMQAKKGKLLVEPMQSGEEEQEGEEEEVDEADKVGMSAQEILALAAKKVKKGRELVAPKHAEIDYLPFRKAFYSAPPEVEELTQEQVDALRLELDDIKIRGAEPPKPATKWSYFGLPAACIDVIKSLEYAAPTSIQAQAIPSIMSGRDIIGVAKTGSGKTMGFILPMFRHIKDQPPLRPMDGPIAMIMTPTRELATQIYKECKPFLKALGLRASCAYGGMPLKDNIADMKRGSEVIVCTPGRMIELLTTNSGRLINLQRVTYLVLDEADRMFDMGFEPQVMKIIGQIRPDRQTVLFSATFPRQMEALARKVLRRPLEITVGGRSVVADTITQVVEVRAEDTKFNRVLELLGNLMNEEEDARALIFVERQESADKLFVELKNKNYTCMPLHGGREQVDRDQTIVDFKNGSCPIVIATSVAARGLDVKQLKLVIQYDVPNHMEDYVHRAGRTGRAGQKGTCVTFITPEQERYSVDILKALQASNAPVPPELEEMAKAFVEKVKAGKAQAAGSGFGGKGLERLDNDRDAAMRAERAAHGEVAGAKKGEEGAEGEESETDKTVKAVTNLEVEIRRGAAPDLAKGKSLPTGEKASGEAKAAAKEAEEVAKKAEADAIAAGKSAGAAGAASVLAKFNAMLKAKKTAVTPVDDHSTEAARRRDPDATDYHAIVWINDYPQKARWKVTNKETMVHFVESTGASITFKGIYYEPGKEPGPNDLPKLHLLIESNEELRVKHAISEIKAALIEGATMALEAEQRQPGGVGGAAMGRYSVV
ncbi:hypothetical protein JCM8547_000466 [Rhodosporidiobolus lusitaniae]